MTVGCRSYTATPRITDVPTVRSVPVIDENLALQGLTREDVAQEFQLLSMGTREQIAVLRALAGMGCGADITSGGELFRARRAGIAADRDVDAIVVDLQVADVEPAVAVGVQVERTSARAPETDIIRTVAIKVAGGQHFTPTIIVASNMIHALYLTVPELTVCVV